MTVTTRTPAVPVSQASTAQASTGQTSARPTAVPPAPSDSLLRVRGLRVAYRDHEVVHGVDLDVRPG